MGQARTGKDTLANHLVRKHGFVRIGLADPLKRFGKDVFDFSDEQLYGDLRDESDIRYLQKTTTRTSSEGVPETVREYLTPRYALQLLGTEWGRHCYKDVWIEYGVRVAIQLLRGGHSYNEKIGLVKSHTAELPPNGIVFSDLRFRNEFDVVKKAGGVMVRLLRDGFSGNVGVADHASEREQKSIADEEFNKVLNNPPGLENYYAAIDEWYDTLAHSGA